MSNHNPFGMQPPKVRQPVRSIGSTDPEGLRPQKMLDVLMGAVQVDEMGRMLVKQEEFENAPPWAIEVMNKCRQMNIEVASISLALIRRGLMTIEELQEARKEINSQVEAQFKQLIANITRGVNQAPSNPPPQQP